MAGDINKLKQLRMGIPHHTTVTLGNDEEEITFAVVLLNSDILLRIEQDTEAYCQENKGKINSNVRTQYYNSLLVHRCLRSTDNLDELLTDNPTELRSLLDPEDIQRIVDKYQQLLVNKAPKLEVISEEEFNELKKFFEVASLKDLNTVSLIHLRSFLQTLTSKI